MESNAVSLRRSWTTLWDAAPYVAHPPLKAPAFALNECVGLLDLAAQAVVRLRENMGEDSEVLPLEGRSLVLLKSALDGEGGICHPADDPVGFVRELVHAAFQTGDGDYSLQLKGAMELDTRLKDQCRDVLDAVERLTQPTEVLEDLKQSAKELEEALKILSSSSPSIEDPLPKRLVFGNKVLQLIREVKHVSQLADEFAKPIVNDVYVPEAQDEVKDVMLPIEPTPDQDEETPLQRTKSQTVKRLKVDAIAKTGEDLREPVQRLRRALSQLSADTENQSSDPQEGYAKAVGDLEQVQKLQQSFRNFGEDLMEGMLALDQLSGLADQDRAVRKQTIGNIQKLMDEIDAAKPRVTKIQRHLTAEVERLKPQQELESESTNNTNAGYPSSSSTKTGTEQPKPLTFPEVEWSRVKLNAKFHSQEKANAYLLSAVLPGLEEENMRLMRTRDGGLAVEGVRKPTSRELQLLKKQLLEHVKSLPDRQRASVTQDDLEKIIMHLGNGKYGLFRQEFELPDDVDVSSISPSYEDGVLRIVLPRVPRRPAQRMGHPLASRRSPYGGIPDYMSMW